MLNRSIALLSAVVVASFFAVTACSQDSKPADKKDPKPAAKKDEAPAKKSEGLKDPSKAAEKAPDTFKVQFQTSKGDFTIEVTRAWAPNGADRFYNLVKIGFFDDCRFFRVIQNFMAQFGLNGDPEVSKAWRSASIKDDARSADVGNKRGYVSFAKQNIPNSRTTQLFINFSDNSRLDGMGFTPFGRVVEGMEIVDKIYSGYGEGAPGGTGPNQQLVQEKGNAYLNERFPNLDYIKKAVIK